jgi:hypothetical protein
MWGNSSHLAEAARLLQEHFPKPSKGSQSSEPEVEVLLCQSNHEEGTYDGIDWGAERAVEEIDEKIREIEDSERKVTRFSITGYSLGGLVSRYIIGILYHRGFFDTVVPMNFATIATPHLGLLTYPNWFSKLSSSLGPKMLGRTGLQFFAKDQYADTGKPLIEIMADPVLLFYKALASFSHVAIFSNAINDRTVPYVTAAIEPYDPFVNYNGKNFSVRFEKGYNPLVVSYSETDKVAEAETPDEHESFSVWLKSKQQAPIPGPFVDWRFPVIVWMALLPILIPIVLIIVPTRFLLSSRSSWARVRLLESDQENITRRLVTLWAKMERAIEDAVEDVVEEKILPATDSEQTCSSPTVIDDDSASIRTLFKMPTSPEVVKAQPLVTPVQLRMISNLNSLPNLTKHIAFIHSVRNSHGAIVCRNMAMKEHHKGVGVLKKWVDGLKL